MIRVEKRQHVVEQAHEDAIEYVIREHTGDGVAQVDLVVRGDGRIAIHMHGSDISQELATAVGRHLVILAYRANQVRAEFEAKEVAR